MTETVADQLDRALTALQNVDDALLPHDDAEEVRHARRTIDTVAYRARSREETADTMAHGGQR